MKPLVIEIHGTGTHNRGAELMAIAIAERMRLSFLGVRLVVPPTQFGDFEARADYRFRTTWEAPGQFRGRLTTACLKYASPLARKNLGVMDPREVDAVLDASGFSFSDQWGPGSAAALVAKMNRRERRHQPLILLPQALGPFETPEVARQCRALFSRAALVCARDSESLIATERLGGAKRLVQYPDFTVGVAPSLPASVEIPERFCAIVPNYRMLDKTKEADSYLAFLEHSVLSVQEAGLMPVFLLHDAKEDYKLIRKANISDNIPVISHSDPRVLKGILGIADFVIASRFHALVSSLSQGVACIGAGWSHKYPELFRDFDCAEFLIEDLSDLGRLKTLVQRLANPKEREVQIARITAAASKINGKTEKMWNEVEQILREITESKRPITLPSF